MRIWYPSKYQCNGGKLAAVALMLLLWVATFALTASPQLHRLLHPDAQSPAHNCLITHLQQQHSLLPGAVTVATPAPALVFVEPALEARVQFRPAPDYRLAPSRAPPFILSFTTVVG